MLKRHEVEILLKPGHRKTEVARLTAYPSERDLPTVQETKKKAPELISKVRAGEMTLSDVVGLMNELIQVLRT
jgi:hypothetical protein